MSSPIKNARAHDRTLSPEALLAKRICEVMAEGEPCEYKIIDSPDKGAGMVIATTRRRKRMGVKYNRAKAVYGDKEEAGMLYICHIRHNVFKTSALISLADLSIDHERKTFAEALGNRMIDGAQGVVWGN